MRAALRKRQCSTNANRTIGVWLTPTREQRDEALVSLRKLTQDPMKIASLGRPAHEQATETNDMILDSSTENFLHQQLEGVEAKRAQLISELKASCDDVITYTGIQAELAVLNVDIDRQRHNMLPKVLQNVEVIGMTIDNCNQMQSGTNRYPRMLREYDIR